jgi:hypothetical protein
MKIDALVSRVIDVKVLRCRIVIFGAVATLMAVCSLYKRPVAPVAPT